MSGVYTEADVKEIVDRERGVLQQQIDTMTKIAAGRERNLARCVIARHSLHSALLHIVETNDEFRAALPKGWEGDPINDACEDAKVILASVKAIVR